MFETTKSNWLYWVLNLLILEKIVQHIFVTLAFYFNWGDIASTVVVPPTVLLILGGIVAILFMFALRGMLKRQVWALNLVIGLALFDILGEFVAQGKIGILITVSFLAATLLLILGLVYRYRINRGARA
jgi:hypothetical protein